MLATGYGHVMIALVKTVTMSYLMVMLLLDFAPA